MATITAFTAAKMQEIADSSIVGGFVDVNGNLILQPRDGDDINAGNVIGPAGPATPLPDRLSVTGKEVSDWDLALETGFYWGNTALNRPPASDGGTGDWHVGVVRSYNSGQRVIQELREVRNGASEVIYTRYWHGSGWTPWTQHNGHPTGLGSSDLDTITANGVYAQTTYVNATLANHYPEASIAGTLEVINYRDVMLVQRYVQRGDGPVRMWMRTKYTTNPWNAWVEYFNGDTGWIRITSGYASGFTDGSTPGNLEYRIKGGICYWSGGVNGTLPSGVYTTVVTGLPTQTRHTRPIPMRTGAGFSGANSGLAEIHSNGTLVLAHSSGANRAWGAFQMAYPVG